MTKTRVMLLATALSAALAAHAQQSGCSQAENDLLARYMPQMVNAMLNGNMVLFKALSDEANAKLSPACQNAIMQQQQQRWAQQQQQRQQARPQGGSGIINHGGGAYSNSEVYCSSSGCMSLR